MLVTLVAVLLKIFWTRNLHTFQLKGFQNGNKKIFGWYWRLRNVSNISQGCKIDCEKIAILRMAIAKKSQFRNLYNSFFWVNRLLQNSGFWVIFRVQNEKITIFASFRNRNFILKIGSQFRNSQNFSFGSFYNPDISWFSIQKQKISNL